MTPTTDFVLVRGPRTDEDDNPIDIHIRVIRNNGTFDFTDYSFLRLSKTANSEMEEWVPTKELHLYKKAFGVE
jgi:hypothetical protein